MADQMTDGTTTLNFISFYGQPQRKRLQIEPIDLGDYNDGVAWRQVKTAGPVFNLTSVVDVDTEADANTAALAYEYFVGKVVDFIKGSITYSDYLVIAVEVKQPERAANAVGGITDGAWTIEADWTLQYAGT